MLTYEQTFRWMQVYKRIETDMPPYKRTDNPILMHTNACTTSLTIYTTCPAQCERLVDLPVDTRGRYSRHAEIG